MNSAADYLKILFNDKMIARLARSARPTPLTKTKGISITPFLRHAALKGMEVEMASGYGVIF